MTTTSKTFTVATLARKHNIDPKRARARLRKMKGLPPCVEGPHNRMDAWTFDVRYLPRLEVALGIRKAEPKAKKAKVETPADANA